MPGRAALLDLFGGFDPVFGFRDRRLVLATLVVIQADQSKVPHLILQRFQALRRMRQEFGINAECALWIVHLFVALGFPHLRVQAADGRAVFREDAMKQIHRILEMEVTVRRVGIVGLSFLELAQGDIQLCPHVIDLGPMPSLELHRIGRLVDELGERFPRRFVLIVSFVEDRAGQSDLFARLVLKLRAVVFVGRELGLQDVHASLAQQQPGSRAIRGRGQRMLRAVLRELFEESQCLIELPLLRLRADRMLGRFAERHRSFIGNEHPQLGRQIGPVLKLLQIQQRPVVILACPQPIQKLAHRLAGITAPAQTQHEPGTHHQHPKPTQPHGDLCFDPSAVHPASGRRLRRSKRVRKNRQRTTLIWRRLAVPTIYQPDPEPHTAPRK